MLVLVQPIAKKQKVTHLNMANGIDEQNALLLKFNYKCIYS